MPATSFPSAITGPSPEGLRRNDDDDDVTCAISHPTPVKPRLRGVFHQYGFFVALVTGPVLIVLAPSAGARAASAVYAVCLATMLGTSAAYHRYPWSPRARSRMRKADHSAIFLAIAGSYTPIAALGLTAGVATAMLIAVWVVAVAGMVAAWLPLPRWIESVTYVGLGWLSVIVLPLLWVAVGATAVLLLIIGGLLYTVGAVILGTRRPDPLPAVFGYHEVWHTLVVTAAILHYVAIAVIVV